jgi:hypothetical protein
MQYQAPHTRSSHVFEGAEYDCPTDLGLNIGRMARQLEVEMNQTVEY